MPSVSMVCPSTDESAAAAASVKLSASVPSRTMATPGLVQNCPTPIVSDPAHPVPSASARAAIAPGNRNIGLIDPSSP